MIDGYIAFELYIAIKLTYDFSNSYDYFTYGGKTKQSREGFTKRKDRYHFYALAKKLNGDSKDIRDYLFVNLLYEPKSWIGDLLDNRCMNRYHRFSKYRNSYKYAFAEEAKHLKALAVTQEFDFNEMVSTRNGTPKLMELVYAETITPYLLHGFHRAFGMLDKWEQKPELFEPLLLDPLHRMKIAQNFIYLYSNHLTKDDFLNTLKSIYVEDT